LTFIGYKQTNRHPNRQAKFIYIEEKEILEGRLNI